MNRQPGPGLVLATTLPLLAAACILPSGLDGGLSPLLAGGLPLAWATVLALFLCASSRGLMAALGAALPFSAYALAAFAVRPLAPWVAVLAGTSLAALAWSRTARPRAGKLETGRPRADRPEASRPLADRPRTDGGAGRGWRLHLAAVTLFGAVPGFAPAFLGFPLAGAAISALSASLALLVLAGRRR